MLIIEAILMDDQAQEITSARCYSKCLQIFIRYKSTLTSKSWPENITRSTIDGGTQQSPVVDEIALQLMIPKSEIHSCLLDTRNSCSKQCIQSCSMVGECICQQNDIGCLLACYCRKEISRSQEECPQETQVEDTSSKFQNSQCPKTCKSKFDCHSNQICCSTETCGMICLQIEKTINLSKYKPYPLLSNTSADIYFDWSTTFQRFLNKDYPLVFILQTRTCLCQNFDEKYTTPWQTLIRTHLLGVTLGAFDIGTIYQFRLAAVTSNGTNGFGPISSNYPTVISKPPLPLPPENMIDYKWQITDEKKFRVEIKWKRPLDQFWRSYEFLIMWMIDHGVAQPDGEPLSSLTQYSKTLLGTEESCTIDELKPSVTYKIQIVTRTFWPGFGNLMSPPCTMYITTPATTDKVTIDSDANTNIHKKDCSCPVEQNSLKDLKIRNPTILNRNLQITLEMVKYSDYLVESYPEVCINSANENLSKAIQRFRKIYKQTDKITLTNLKFNCRYSIEIMSTTKNLPNTTYHLCFCTPNCNSNTNNHPYLSKYCHKEDLSIPSPKEPKSSLLDLDTMTYKISWKPSYRISPRNRILDITRYRISWAPRKFEPVRIEHYFGSTGLNPIIDFDQSDVRIVHSNITRFLLRNLTRQQLYVVKIQSLGLTLNGEIIESFPATILLPTYGYSEQFYTKSCQRIRSTYLLIFIYYFLSRQLLAL